MCIYVRQYHSMCERCLCEGICVYTCGTIIVCVKCVCMRVYVCVYTCDSIIVWVKGVCVCEGICVYV